ncbi:cob(I)yrinic acid a,c-diamide adenosyltransferase [Bacillus alveayuensis]|jgi:cob(I)alamin adenosyltransferase|uniref:cob(I)yrinic acid a,c-diamide adenosyltransferase n=1 Tax=Aeribacillus alveayuensis TaxID=279215 RepID=UPI0005D0EC0D|nr:cob(I)yrinic acid a,c-diamide adenosyltransferase [Bacillus alveayuensis]
MKQNKKGKILIYTGDGKGKTTAALGLAIRALGRGLRVLIIQFMKSPERTYGEKIIFEKLGVEIVQKGAGFTWTKTPEEHRQALKDAWHFTKEKVYSGEYDLIILDELNNALSITTFNIDDVLPLHEVLQLMVNKPHHLHLVITGRKAKEEVKNKADLVTEMRLIKHYYSEGTKAIKGIEF